ncbi:MAG: hypothetical protein ACU83V_08990, partial [Gammaproteobacteria bacterium]
MKQAALYSIGLLFFSTLAYAEEHASPQRMSEVQHQRQFQVPYAADKALETISKTVHGGVMHVISKAPDDCSAIPAKALPSKPPSPSF